MINLKAKSHSISYTILFRAIRCLKFKPICWGVLTICWNRPEFLSFDVYNLLWWKFSLKNVFLFAFDIFCVEYLSQNNISKNIDRNSSKDFHLAEFRWHLHEFNVEIFRQNPLWTIKVFPLCIATFFLCENACCCHVGKTWYCFR